MFVLLTVFLIVNIISSIYRRIYNISSVNLCCGIYGYSGKLGLSKNDVRIALQKFKILGLYNEERGRDSCGVYINNNLKKGILATKLFSNFIETETFEISSRNRVMLGHNRSASTGSSVNLENAHPFLIDDDMIITHNGTLKETLEFCAKYNLPWKDMTVDTIMLGTALYRNDNTVLENYKGAAALAFTYRSRPNTLYLYHGSSRDKKDGVQFEERPLFYMETREGIYYSSMDIALNAIRENDDEISIKLPHNVVFEIKDGVFTHNDVNINRGDINIEPVRVIGRGGAWNRHYGHYEGLFPDTNPYAPFREPVTKHSAINKSYTLVKNGLRPVDTIISLQRETVPQRLIEEKESTYVYYFRGRHWIHHPNSDDVLADGILWIADKSGKGYVLLGARKSGVVMYFYKGNMLRDKAAYDQIKDNIETRTALETSNSNYAQYLSRFTEFPVFDVDQVSRSGYKWYNDEKIANTPFTPKFSNRTYKLVGGFLHGITSSDKETCFYEEVTRAEEEYQLYKDGGLISGIVGKHFDVEDVQLSLERMAHSKSDLEWYERRFDDNGQAKKAIGKLELIALDYYSKWFLEQDNAWTTIDEHIADKTSELIEETVGNGLTIEEAIGDEEGINVLKAKYKTLVDDIFVQDSTPTFAEAMGIEIDERPDDKSLLQYDGVQKVVRLVEDLFNHIKELHENAGELQELGIEEANEMAFRIYQLISEFRAHCNSSVMFKIDDFNEFFEKMNKLQDNGIV